MLKKCVPVLAGLSLLGACSHQPMKTMHKKSPHAFKISKSWIDAIKTRKPGKPTDQRTPASKKNIPGLKEFIAAIKATPNVFNVPVGYEVISEDRFTFEGQLEVEQETTVYLKQNRHGNFSVISNKDGLLKLEIDENESIESLEISIAESTNFKEIKKITQTKFTLVVAVADPNFKGSCELTIDLNASAELFSSSCIDEKGALISESKVISVKPIQLGNYKAALTSIKATISPRILSCNMVTVDGGEEEKCFESITDESLKNWSYILD